MKTLILWKTTNTSWYLNKVYVRTPFSLLSNESATLKCKWEFINTEESLKIIINVCKIAGNTPSLGGGRVNR